MMRFASTGSVGSLWCSMYARYGPVHVASTSMTSMGSFSLLGGLLLLVAGVEGLAAGRSLMDLCVMRSRKTPGSTGTLSEPMLARASASSLLSRPMCRNSAVERALQLVVQVSVGDHVVGDGVARLHGLMYDEVGVA